MSTEQVAHSVDTSPPGRVSLGSRDHTPHMTTLISESTTYAGYFTLTTEKGKTFDVSTCVKGRVTVYIKRNGLQGLSYGRTFTSLGAAIEAYKAKDVKAALYALAER